MSELSKLFLTGTATAFFAVVWNYLFLFFVYMPLKKNPSFTLLAGYILLITLGLEFAAFAGTGIFIKKYISPDDFESSKIQVCVSLIVAIPMLITWAMCLYIIKSKIMVAQEKY